MDDESLPADFTIRPVNPADFEDWVELALELCMVRRGGIRLPRSAQYYDTLPGILNAEYEMG